MNRGRLIGYKVLSDSFSRLSVFGVILLSARLLPPEQFGVFSLAWSAGWIVAVSSDFGLQISLARDVARQPLRSAETFRNMLRFRRLLCAVLLLVVVMVVLATDWPGQKSPFLLIIFSQILNSLVDFYNHLFRGFSRSDLESSLNLVSRSFTVLLVIVVLAVVPDLLSLSLALFVGSLASLGGAQLLSRGLLKKAGIDATGRSHPDRIESGNPGQLYREVLPIGLGILFSSVYFRLDLFFIEVWRGSEAVAHYNAVFKLVDALRLFPAAVLAVIFPELCRSRTTRLFLVSVSGILALAIVLTGGGVWLADAIISLCYGRGYLVATNSFRILLFSLPFLFVNFILTHRLIAKKRQHAFAALCALGLVVSVNLNYLLVPQYGIEGAAFSCLLREAVLTAACVVLLIRRRPADFLPGRANRWGKTT